RLDLAQYRELAAFAQFGSDLDKATLAQLTRGEKMTELLKQGQYVPMKLAEQVIVIFCGTSGHLDDVPTASLKKFEVEFLKFVFDKYGDIPKEIEASNDMTAEVEKKLTTAVEQFKAGFRP
ncbi:MAG TPA: F0F1 ATP synthase subunit alpha, partial [bacterium]|nr:F0F1 ATP synthase subunit alpha [bacterium]